jgi:hypothetical protein
VRTKTIGLMDIYRTHAVEYTEEELERKKPDNALLEEIDRKTRFLEEMMTELQKKTTTNLGQNKELITKCTKMNETLITELTQVRDNQATNGS